MVDQASSLRALMAGRLQPSLESAEMDSNMQTKVIAVTSGKGGVGKTTVAVNLAIALAQSGHRTLLVDADLGLANVDVMLGINAVRHVGHILLTDMDAADVAEDGPNGLKVISGGSGLRELADASSIDRAALRSKLRAYYDRFDFVVVDTSPGIGEQVTDFLTDADDILVVTTPEPTAIRDTYAALKTIARRVPESDPCILVNRGSKKEADAAAEKVNAVAKKFLGRSYELVDHIDVDYSITKAVHVGKPFIQMYPMSHVAACFRRVSKMVAGNQKRSHRVDGLEALNAVEKTGA